MNWNVADILHQLRSLDETSRIEAKTGLPRGGFRRIGSSEQAEEPNKNQAEIISRPELRPESRPESLAFKVLRLLNHQPLGKSDMAKALGHKTISSGLNKQVRNLVARELIEMTLPDKPRSRNQRYQLTSTGRALLNLKEQN